MKKICILVSILVSIAGGVIFNIPSKQETPKLEQVNVSEKIVEDKVGEDLQTDVKNNTTEKSESNEILEQEQKEEKQEKQEVKSESKPQEQKVSSASKSEKKSDKSKTENKANNNVSSQAKEESKQEAPKENKKSEQNSNSTNNQQSQNGVTTKFYESITGGKKEFSSESEAFARGTEIQNKELDYVLDYNELHPEAPIQPDINYFRVYPSFIDENGNYWYYLHFFCQSGEGKDEYLKNRF